MATPSSADAGKWKSKYYEVLDRFDKKEAEWIKSEKLFNKAITRLSILSEGQSPLIDHHLQALRVVLKEKFSYYRVESVLSELFKIISEVEKKSAKKVKLIDVSVLLEILNSIDLTKPLQKKRTALCKQLEKTPETASELVPELKNLLSDAIEEKTATKPGGLLSKLFSNSSDDHSVNILQELSDSVAALPWPEKLIEEKISLVKSVKNASSEEDLNTALKQFKQLAAKWPESDTKAKDFEQTLELSETAANDETISIKQQCLNQLVDNLKGLKPQDSAVQSIELSDQPNELVEKLAENIASLLGQPQGQSADKLTASSESVKPQPDLKELFIQLVEQLLVPVALMDKAEELKTSLETELSTDWRRSLKKVVHFINEVRFNEYNEEDEYENFLQQITTRLQEMVQFIEQQNQATEQTDGKGSALNKAMIDEVAGLKQGVESAGSLQELQQIVNSRLDAISDFVKQHHQLDDERRQSTKDNFVAMQQKISELEKESIELKVTLAKKNKEAMYDVLTAIPNRLFYEKRVQEDIGRWKRFDTPLSIAIWDVDKFKSVNDTYGHKAGDKVLKAIAQILNKRIRDTDFLARYGGEEFVMLLPGTVEEETLRLTNELRKSVEACAFHYNDESVDITISCGISGFRQGDELNAVFERADKALYQAKEAGRNRCVIAACKSS